jgi:hypothetical protein
MTESQEQRTVVEWAAWKGLPIFAIPNGGKREIHTATRLKAEGVRAGVPDLFLPIASQGFHGLFVEMKRADGGTVSAKQQEWLDLLNANGYRAVVCHGADEAIEQIGRYLA